MKKLAILATGAALAALSLSAQASFRLNATRPGNFSSTATSVAVPLNAAGATLLSFNLTANKKLVLSYSAECQGGGTSGWVDIDVVVNGVAVAPTAGSSDAFCSAGNAGWVRPAITVQIQGITGNIQIQIIGRRTRTTTMWFGDSALVVFDP